jgi:hypothetical protein
LAASSGEVSPATSWIDLWTRGTGGVRSRCGEGDMAAAAAVS